MKTTEEHMNMGFTKLLVTGTAYS